MPAGEQRLHSNAHRMPTRLRRLEHSLVCPPRALALGVLAELAVVLWSAELK